MLSGTTVNLKSLIFLLILSPTNEPVLNVGYALSIIERHSFGDKKLSMTYKCGDLGEKKEKMREKVWEISVPIRREKKNKKTQQQQHLIF